jgi:hypothetical protein
MESIAAKLIRYRLERKIMTTAVLDTSKIIPIMTEENPPMARPTFKITLLAVERI